MLATHRCLLLGFLLACVLGLSAVYPGETAAPAAEKDPLPFTLPPGFVAERIAGPPLVQHPMMASFDERGRLFVTDAAGVNLRAPDLLDQLPNRIQVLEDTDGDGRFDTGHTFADRMTFPMGALWHGGSLYSCAPPSLWKMEARGDRAGKRQELVTKFGFSGNAASIHGPFLGPDGRIYWTDGRHGHEIHTREGTLLQGKAARIFRCRPDGRDVEVVCGGGMDDPVEIAFTPEGDAIATVDIYESSPRRVDALIHCVEGGVFPYNPVYKEFKQTGGLLPPVLDLGWVAPVGLMRYRGEALGAEFQDNLFGAQFNTHKIQRYPLQRTGASFQAGNEAFLVSTNPDFHPTDVLEDADGSLLVINTGGWFRIGCPTSQIAKPEIKGAIYRIRRTDAKPLADARGLKITWDRLSPRDLTTLLGDPRWMVRDRAITELAQRGTAAIPVLSEVLTKAKAARARRNAVWSLCRIEDTKAHHALLTALKDRDASVRQAATHAVGLNRVAPAQPQLQELVVRDTPAIRRSAAAALGRLGNKESVPALLRALSAVEDRFLEHALVLALIRIGDAKRTLAGLQESDPRIQRGALLALDQMAGDPLAKDKVVPLLETGDPALQQAVLDVIGHHPGWASAVEPLLRRELVRAGLSNQRREQWRDTLLALGGDPAIQRAMASLLARRDTPEDNAVLLLEVMARAPVDPLPRVWVDALGAGLKHPSDQVVQQAIVTLRDRNVKAHAEALRALAANEKKPATLRVLALAALGPRLRPVKPALFDFLCKQLSHKAPALERLQAADTLARLPLDKEQQLTLTAHLAEAGPLELPYLLECFRSSKDAEVGKKLLASLARSPGLPAIAPTTLRQVLEGYPEDVRTEAGALERRLSKGQAEQQARLRELEPVLSGGNPVQGKTVFYGLKAACATCHTVARRGGNHGPDLSKIGAIRSERDLLEAIIFPSASIVRGYEPYLVQTHAGRTFTGILSQQTADAIFLITPERAEVRIPRKAVETLAPSPISIMPQGLENQLSQQELRDLLAYLKSLH